MNEIEQITLWLQKALIGEIYNDLIAVSFQFDDMRALTVNYYTLNEPTDEDYERADIVLTNLLANTSNSEQIKTTQIKCHKFRNKYSEVEGIVVIVKDIDA